MLRTIAIGSSLLVQGIYVKTLANGLVVVRDGSTTYQGTLVS